MWGCVVQVKLAAFDSSKFAFCCLISTAVHTVYAPHGHARRRRFRTDSQICSIRAHPLYCALGRQGLLDPIKLAYDPRCLKAGSQQPASSATRSVCHQSWSQGVAVTQNLPFSSLAVALALTSTHCAYPRRDSLWDTPFNFISNLTVG